MAKKNRRRRRAAAIVADNNNDPPPMPFRQQQPVWVPEPFWEPSPVMRRNPNLYGPQDSFVPPPMEPPPTAVARDDEINARFQDVLRGQAELALSIDRLRVAITASPAVREIGPGHNQGPPLQIGELDAEDKRLLALLQDNGPRPSPADRALIAEQAEKTFQLSERIRTWLARLAAEAAKLGAREILKDLTAPLWEEVARWIVNLYHYIIAWLASLLS